MKDSRLEVLAEAVINNCKKRFEYEGIVAPEVASRIVSNEVMNLIIKKINFKYVELKEPPPNKWD